MPGDLTETPLGGVPLAGEGTPVRYVKAIFVPDHETCFFLCEAGSVEAVRETARRAALTFERIAQAVAPTRIEEVPRCL